MKVFWNPVSEAIIQDKIWNSNICEKCGHIAYHFVPIKSRLPPCNRGLTSKCVTLALDCIEWIFFCLENDLQCHQSAVYQVVFRSENSDDVGWAGRWSAALGRQRDGKTCTDINECLLSPEICEGGGVCVNTEGSFTCDCPPGLTLDSSRTKCVDLREEACYLQYRSGQCDKPLAGAYKRAMCCCTVGAAWGNERWVKHCLTCAQCWVCLVLLRAYSLFHITSLFTTRCSECNARARAASGRDHREFI